MKTDKVKDIKKFVTDFYKAYGEMMSKFATEDNRPLTAEETKILNKALAKSRSDKPTRL